MMNVGLAIALIVAALAIGAVAGFLVRRALVEKKNAAARSEAEAILLDAQKKAEAMPRPGAEVEAQVRSSINVAEVQQTVCSFLESFIRIGMNNAYGSQALLNALGPVMNSMPAGQE